MWAVIKRLSLGILLIVLASSILLLFDVVHRKTSRKRAALEDPIRLQNEGLQAARVPRTSGLPTRVPQSPPAGQTFKVGVVYFAPEPGVETCMRGLFDGLRDRGFVEGTNLEVHKAHAQAEIANIPALYQSFDTQDFDLIVPMSTPCLTAACGTVKHTPVVFTYVYDPIAAGAGTSSEEHNPNVTGVGSFPPIEDTVEFIQRLLPGAKKVGTLYNSSEANSRKVVSVARDVFARRGIRFEEVTVINSSEVFQAAQALAARGVEALWIAGDNTAIQGFDAIVKVANDGRVPLITSDIEPVAKASLATVGVGFYQPGYAAGQLAARVLLGERPRDLPFQNVSIKTVSLNLTVARRLGIRISDDVLRSAEVLIDETGVHQQAAP
jgi:putative ABC transport system substrate-binding protein